MQGVGNRESTDIPLFATRGAASANNNSILSEAEHMLQISIGGNPEEMKIGKFSLYKCLRDCPNININCACGLSA